MYGGADPDGDDHQGKGEICKVGCVSKVFNVNTHIGTVMMYVKDSKDRENGIIKKYPVWKTKFHNKYITNFYSIKYYKEYLYRDKLGEALELYEVQGGGMGNQSCKRNL